MPSCHPLLSLVLARPAQLSHISARAGQLFILHTIRRYGALLFAGVMTTRQFLSILVSSAVFGNPLSAGQWCGSLPLTALHQPAQADTQNPISPGWDNTCVRRPKQ